LNRKFTFQDKEIAGGHKSSFLGELWEILHFLRKTSVYSSTPNNIIPYVNGEPITSYVIGEHITSPATKVIFPTNDRKVCLKVWLPCHNDVYDTKDIATRTAYLLEGLAFNRKFAKDVCLGVAPVIYRDEHLMQCGQVISQPEISQVQFDVDYALIMNRLEKSWRLDRKLHGVLDNQKGMEFLAKEVARIHKQLTQSRADMGTPECIASKMEFNIQLFDKAVNALSDLSASRILRKACAAFTDKFKQRYINGYIKRCHGDLKATNLWIPSHEGEMLTQLLALDCVDFNPYFCHIDTLSDVAMLAVDIEVRLTYLQHRGGNKRLRPKLSRYFLEKYLKVFGENIKEVWPLLEYYMTEKAMVCAYMSILYDGLPSLGEKYIKVANAHAHNLEELLISPNKLPSYLRKK